MIRTFISHSWAYSDAYERLSDLLRAASGFQHQDLSVPKDDPIHNARNDAELASAIARQMQPAQVVLVLAGVYATHSRWINIEVQMAKRFAFPKPIVAIEPWGAERTSAYVKQHADRIVGWNTDSIVRAIREVAR